MKIKIVSLGILFLLISGAFIGNGKLINIESDNGLETIEISIAVLTQERGWWARDLIFFKDLLCDYKWIVGVKQYIFDVNLIVDDDILKGNLNLDNYDMIVMAGGAIGDGEAFVRCNPTLENFKWKKNLADFIKDGGGYFSVCGGTALITDLDLERETRSFLEYAYEKSSLGVTWVKSHYKEVGNAIFCEMSGLPSEYLGVAAYGVFTGWNISNFTVNHRGGICQDYQINRSHPIFDDYLSDTRKIRWCGGPSLTIPDKPDREVSVLARYPVEEMSDNESTRIYAWKYAGGIRGMIKGLIKGFKDRDVSEFHSSLSAAYTHAEDWERTNKTIETDYSNQPAITAEIYPNNNKARIVLSGLHTERNVWWGGEYQEVKDHEHNTLWEGFVKLVNITQKPFDLEWTYNYWLNRRCIAWAAKVPNDDLPPVYGPSQVCDFEDDVDSEVFTVNGNSEIADGITSLELFYRYSDDKVNWSNWRLFDTDYDESDGWSWEFNSPNGTGYYQFYSIRKVEYEGYVEIENIPEAADSFVFVETE